MQCEKLMLEGYTQPTELARRLKIARNTAASYIKIILNRWAEYWSMLERKKAAGRQLRKNEKAQKQMWELIKKNTKPAYRIGSIRTIIESIKVENKILGLEEVSSRQLPEGSGEEFDTYEIWKKKKKSQQ